MDIAILSGLIILVLLVIMLVSGVPIAVALGVSSICERKHSRTRTGLATATSASRARSARSFVAIQNIPPRTVYAGGKKAMQRRGKRGQAAGLTPA